MDVHDGRPGPRAIPSATISSTVIGITFWRARDHGPFTATSIQTDMSSTHDRNCPLRAAARAALGRRDIGGRDGPDELIEVPRTFGFLRRLDLE